MEKRSYEIRTNKKSIMYKDKKVLVANIKYPEFVPLNNSKKEVSFVNKINRFYLDSVKRYLKYLSRTGAKKADKMLLSNGTLPSFVMNCTVSYADELYISVFADVSIFDGNKTKTYRFSQLWSYEHNALLSPSYIFNIKHDTKKYIKKLICEIAENNMRKGIFSYFSNYKRLINRHISFLNAYLVPDGVAFYIDSGKLSDSYPVCVFVIPYVKIDGLLKIYPAKCK